MEPLYTACPIVRTERGPFARWIDLSGGHGPMGLVTFETEIIWIRESTARLVLLDAAGEEVNDGATFNDFYGFLTSIQEHVENAPATCRKYGVTRDGPLSVQVLLTVEDLPGVRAKTDDGRWHPGGRLAYHGIGKDWYRANDPALPAWVAAPTWQARYDLADRPVYVEDRTVFQGPIWSSRNGLTREDQRLTRLTALAKAMDGLPADVGEATCARLKTDVPAPRPDREG